jgi:hypothetical protein
MAVNYSAVEFFHLVTFVMRRKSAPDELSTDHAIGFGYFSTSMGIT